MKYKKVGKIIGVAAVCIAVIIFLYGRMHMDYEKYDAKRQQGTKQVQNEEKDSQFPRTYQKSADNLEFDVQVVCEEGIAAKGVPKAAAEVASLNQQSMYQYFMGNSSNVQSETDDNYYSVDGKISTLTSYRDDSGCELWIADVEGAYGTPRINYIDNAFSVSRNAEEYNGDLYSKTSNLPFMDREKAWDTLTGIMGKIGIDWTNVKEKEVYSLDVATLQKEESCIDVNGNVVEEEKNPNWSKADEGYYYFLGQQFCGMPLYGEYKVGQGEEELDSSPLRIYQNQDGICFLYISRWFSIQKQKETYQLAPFQKIMDVIEEKYTGTVKTNPLKVEKATLYEYPLKVGDDSYNLIPVWICSIAEEMPGVDGETYVNYFRIPIHAVTGEEMPELEE